MNDVWYCKKHEDYFNDEANSGARCPWCYVEELTAEVERLQSTNLATVKAWQAEIRSAEKAEKQVETLREAIENETIKPDYTNPEGIIRRLRQALKDTGEGVL